MKQCIFCKEPSDNSKSVEHIIPESMGNTKNYLPPGIVCDKCNNYFASKVELPLLASGAFRNLRFDQQVLSKKKRIPSLDVWLGTPEKETAFQAKLFHMNHPEVRMGLLLPEPAAIEFVKRAQNENFRMSSSSFGMPEPFIMSRFLAKCALEALAQRLMAHGLDTNELANDHQFDAIRDHARRGTKREWPFGQRKIYEMNRLIEQDQQTIYEYGLLLTTPRQINSDGNIVSEVYFVAVIFGMEFAINYGGADISTYNSLILEHANTPLLDLCEIFHKEFSLHCSP